MQPLVSILIPAYNCEQWIAEAIRSALAQTWRRTEIVVVDDGSTDNTLRVARSFTSTNVRILTQEHQGAAAARNAAFSVCQGDFIQWLDADDVLDAEKTERQLQATDEQSSRTTLLSGAWGRFFHRRRKAKFLPTALWADLTPLEWLLRKMESNLYMQTDSWLVSRELSEAAGPWDARLWRDNDGEYFCRVILASNGVRFVPEARSYYRSAGFTSVNFIGGSRRKLESLFLSMTLHIQYVRSLDDSERVRRACVRYIQASLHEFYPFRLDLAAKLKELALELGAPLEDPRLSWKYQWIVNGFGWANARRVQIAAPKLKHSIMVAWDKMMNELESGRRGIQ